MYVKSIANNLSNWTHSALLSNHFLFTEAKEHLVCGVAGLAVIPKESFDVILQIGGEIGVLRTPLKATESDVNEQVLPPFLTDGGPFIAICCLLNDGKGSIQRTKLSDDLAFIPQFPFYRESPTFTKEPH